MGVICESLQFQRILNSFYAKNCQNIKITRKVHSKKFNFSSIFRLKYYTLLNIKNTHTAGSGGWVQVWEWILKVKHVGTWVWVWVQVPVPTLALSFRHFFQL